MGYTADLIPKLEAQGAKVRKTKKGILVTTVVGSYSMHDTPSDHRSLANETAGLKRIGIAHPLAAPKPPKKKDGDKPLWYAEGTVSARSIAEVRSALYAMEWPLEVYPADVKTTLSLVTVPKVLYALGYRPREGRRTGRRGNLWIAGDEVRRLHEDFMAKKAEEPTQEVPAIPLPQRPVTPAPEPDAPQPEPMTVEQAEPEKAKSGEREFIDSHDSWVAHPPLNLTVGDYIEFVKSVGLDIEFRVWKKED